MQEFVLVLNTGSSSLKLGVYRAAEGVPEMLLDGEADRVGQPDCALTLRNAAGQTVRTEALAGATEEAALERAVGWLAELGYAAPAAVGHRVVHGGPRLTEHQRITPEVMRELERCVHFAPLHIPLALSLIAAAEKAYATAPQFACFDTAFHRTLPEVAARLPIPGEMFEEGIRRYGFHGLSYESIVRQLGGELERRTVIAHLGSGASVAAVEDGRSVDTSMGLTPSGGLPMATRTGDLDPGVLLFLLRQGEMTADAMEELVNQRSGLLALSGGLRDMRAIEAAAAAGDGRARLAFEAFAGAVAKYVAAYATVLGGLEMLVFTGGIGEHSAAVREAVCQRLSCLRVVLDDAANRSNAPRLERLNSVTRVRVLPSQEDRQIALHCLQLLRGRRGGGV